MFGKALLSREPEWLIEAKRHMPRILLSEIDVSILLKRIGQDISGAGMDPNIVDALPKERFPISMALSPNESSSPA